MATQTPPGRNPLFVFRVPPSTLAAAKRIATARGLTLSAWARAQVEGAIRRSETAAARAAKRKAARR